MELLHKFIDLFLHLDKHLDNVVGQYGPWVYLLLFVIVFCETGLVVTPILPGDSLLFAAGAVAAHSGKLDPGLDRRRFADRCRAHGGQYELFCGPGHRAPVV